MVLGQQQADASRAEAAHRADFDGSASPLEHARYQQAELSLLRLVDAQADNILSQVAQRYRSADAPGRIASTASLTMNDFYTIKSFARRSAARALLSSQPDSLVDALTALAMIASDRIDKRDISWTASYLRLAGTFLAETQTVDEMFESAAEIAEPVTAGIIRSFTGTGYDDVCASWLMTVTEFEGRSVIVESGKDRFEPTSDVLGIAMQLRQILEADGYSTGDPVVESAVGSHWLDGSPGAQAILDRSVASVRVRVIGRPEQAPMEQLFMAHVYELASAEAAVEFRAAWERGERDFAALVVSVGRLLVLVISRSSVRGVPTAESDERLGRFEQAVRSALS